MVRLLSELQGEQHQREHQSPRRHPADSQALKKIINSLAAGRPASEAALLASGGRPKRSDSKDSGAGTPAFGAQSVPDSNGTDLEPLPAEAAPPTGGQMLYAGSVDRTASFKAHRDAFFFLLQRELEKVRA